MNKNMRKNKIIAEAPHLLQVCLCALAFLLLPLVGGARGGLEVGLGTRHCLLTAKFSVQVNTEQRAVVDSTMRAQPGVFSVSWSPHRQILIVVYNRMVTNKRRLKRAVELISLSEDNAELKPGGISN